LLVALAVALAAGLAQLPAPVSAAALPARTVSPAPAGATGPLDPLVPDAASLTAVAAQLPPDPVDAAEALVGTIFGADDVAAVAATGELLRRAGLPLVSATGPVVALPDRLTIISDPIDV